MTDSNQRTKHYEVRQREKYIYLKFKGKIVSRDLHDSTDEIVKIAEEEKKFLLLDDIRELDRTSVTIKLQSEAIGILWHLRIFKKIALVYKDDEIGRLVKLTLETISFIPRCDAFDNEREAIEWLMEKSD